MSDYMGLGGERHSVQNTLIDYAKETSAEYTSASGSHLVYDLGWEYISSDEALRLRKGKDGLVLREVFINQIQDLNSDFMDHLLAEDLINDINAIPPNIEGNQIAWEYLKGLRSIFVPNGDRERNVKLIDTVNINRNTFHVTDEFEFTNGNKTIRADVVFLINGMPVFIIETKAAHKLDGIDEALSQIKRYHEETPELLAFVQIYAMTHIIHFYYSGTWNFSSKWLFNWKEETDGNYELLVKSFLDRQRVIKVLSEFILFTRQDDELKKVVLRPHQMRAVDRVVERASDDEKQHGLIWHTQGSGKTYTMIVVAQNVLKDPDFENPTVIMLVDRNELETQLFGNLAAVGFQHLEVAGSKQHLEQLLDDDRRGLIVSTIHKFEKMPGNVCPRENVFVLVDEAHRTTGGKLGNYLMGALPNATYLGFTGTPIDKTSYGKGTFVTFGKDDLPHGYLDKYSISESIEDGTTVPLHYTLASNELTVNKDILESEFLDIADTQGISDIESLNKVLEKAVTLTNLLKNWERIQLVASYVADHYIKYIETMGYKAFLVAVDREACARYKEELDKHLPEEYSEVVFSPNHNDPEYLRKYHLSSDEEKSLRKKFRRPNEFPKILIVTEKLLTGFDAPILYCMYLDKPMRDHVLLQAIARVNRPYEDDEGRRKPSGFVLDFVGIFDNLEKALAFDSQDIEGVVRDIGILKSRFEDLMSEARQKYLVLIQDKGPDKAVENLLEYFKNEDERQEYYRFFRELSDIYEIVSPDEFLRPYIMDYETLARMYRILREAFESRTIIDKELMRKTANLVQEQTTSSAIRSSLEVYKIDEDTLKKIEESGASDTEKVFNLLRSIEKTIQDNVESDPYLISIGEKAENISQMFKNRQKTTEETLKELKRIVDEINTARKEQVEKNMSKDVFTIFWLLKREDVKGPEDKARDMEEVLHTYQYYSKSEEHERQVRRNIYKLLVKGGMTPEEITQTAKKVMKALKVIKDD